MHIPSSMLKKLICPVLTATLVLTAGCAQQKLSGYISISGAFALYPVAVKWSSEFRKTNPGVRIDISAGGAGKGITDVLTGMVDIGMVSREIYPEEFNRGAFAVTVGRDAVVAIVNEHNPFINEILKKGLRKDVANALWISGTAKSWKNVLTVNKDLPVHVYTRSDACGAAGTWASWFSKKQEDLLGIGVFGDPGLIQAVAKDTLAIGFSNISYVYDASTGKHQQGIRTFPLDTDNSGYIESCENFYGSSGDFLKGVSEGKYPSPPARKLYFVFRGYQQKNVTLSSLIRWVLTDGQKFLAEAGYICISPAEAGEQLKKFQ